MKKQILTKVVDKKDAAGRDHSKWSVNGEGQYNKQEIVQHTVLYVFGNLLKSMPLEKAVEYFNTTAKCTKAPLVVIDNAKYPKYKETVVSDGSSNYTVYAKDWLEPDEAPVFVEKVNANFVSLEAGNESDCKSETVELTLEKAEKDGKYGCLDSSGREVIPFVYDSVYVRGNLIEAEKEHKWGCLDMMGKEVIPFVYDRVDVRGNLIEAKKNGKYGLFDLTGKEVVPVEYDSVDCRAFNDAITVCGKGNTLVFGTNGKLRKTLEYDSVFKHTKGDDEYLLVRKGNLWGKLDLDGNEILPCEYCYYILGIDYKHDEVFSIGDAKENLGLEEVTEDSINEYMEDNGYDGLIHLGEEKEVDTNHYITSVEGVELYPCDKGEEEWYKSIYDIEMQEIDIDDIEFEPADYDIADGVTIVAGWKTCSQYFELLIHDGEQFDPEQLLVCGKEKCADADFDAIYQGIPLSLIGSTGDEDGDYYVSAALYADGEHICEDSDFLDDDEDEWD